MIVSLLRGFQSFHWLAAVVVVVVAGVPKVQVVVVHHDKAQAVGVEVLHTIHHRLVLEEVVHVVLGALAFYDRDLPILGVAVAVCHNFQDTLTVVDD